MDNVVVKHLMLILSDLAVMISSMAVSVLCFTCAILAGEGSFRIAFMIIGTLFVLIIAGWSFVLFSRVEKVREHLNPEEQLAS